MKARLAIGGAVFGAALSFGCGSAAAQSEDTRLKQGLAHRYLESSDFAANIVPTLSSRAGKEGQAIDRSTLRDMLAACRKTIVTGVFNEGPNKSSVAIQWTCPEGQLGAFFFFEGTELTGVSFAKGGVIFAPPAPPTPSPRPNTSGNQ